MILDTQKLNLGIDRIYFQGAYHGMIPGDTLYKNREVASLLDYDDETIFYGYEDDHVLFYSPSSVNKGLLFFRLKQFLHAQNEEYTIVLSGDLRNITDPNTAFVGFTIIYKLESILIEGVLITPRYYMFLLNEAKNESSTKGLFFPDKGITQFKADFFVKEITINTLDFVFEYIINKVKNDKLWVSDIFHYYKMDPEDMSDIIKRTLLLKLN